MHTVICTHFDIDHVGYHPEFRSAEFIVQREHYEMARDGHPRLSAARPYWDDPKLLDLAAREQVALVVFGHDGGQWRSLKQAPEYYE